MTRGVFRGVILLSLLQPASASALDPSRNAHQYFLQQWSDEEGLPQSSVRALAQSTDGYLWVGTENGLARFDGVRFEVFEDGFSMVTSILADPDGTIWVGTEDDGVLAGRDGEFRRVEGLPSRHATAIHRDREGRLWIGTGDQGVLRADGNAIFHRVGDHEGPGSAPVHAIASDRDDTVWIGTEAGGFRWDGSRFLAAGTDAPVRALLAASDGSMWFGTRGKGVVRVQEGRTTRFGTDEGMASEQVVTLAEDRDGSIWVGTNGGGLHRLRSGELELLRKHDGLASDLVWSLLEDAEGSLWIGMNAGGLGRLRDTAFVVYGQSEGLSSSIALALLEDSNGSMWVGTAGAGLNRLENGRWERPIPALDGAVVLSLHEGNDGALWIGTGGGGLFRWRDGTLTRFDSTGGLPSGIITAVREDRDGRIWVGTQGRGLFVLHADGTRRTFTTEDGLPSEYIFALHEDATGALWVGTRDGLCRIDLGTVTQIDDLPGSPVAVSGFHEDDDRTLWIATRRGLVRYLDGRFLLIDERSGLAEDDLHAVVDDGQGSLWLSSNRGIFRVPRLEIDEFAAGKRAAVRSSTFGTADGLRTREANGGIQPAAWRRKDGTLWFPTLRGVASVDPGAIRRNDLPPPVHVESLIVDGMPRAVAGAIRLDPAPERIEIRYTASSLRMPERLRFEIRLDGFDDHWTDLGRARRAFFTALGPGDYRFRVRAFNENGVSSPEEATLAFTIAPRFHQTRAFLLACLIAPLALGVGAHHLRTGTLRARQAELERRVEERTAELAHANRELEAFSYSVSHDLRAPLRNVRAYAEMMLASGADDEVSKRRAKRIASAAGTMHEMIDSLLELAKHTRGELRRTNVDLAVMAGEIIDDLRRSAPERRAEISIQPGMSANADPRLVRIVLENLLGNAWKFTAGRDVTRLEVAACGATGQTVFRVRDNGVGFDTAYADRLFEPFQRLHSETLFAGIGVGLATVRRVVQRHGGIVHAESDPDRGSAFFFSLEPLGERAATGHRGMRGWIRRARKEAVSRSAPADPSPDPLPDDRHLPAH